MKRWYLDLLEKDKKGLFATIFYFFLCLLSYLYAIIIIGRNFLYDRKVFSETLAPKKVISVGSLSWGGSGKTTLSIWLYKKLSSQFKVAILRRGYGEDENSLIRQKQIPLYASRHRQKLACSLSKDFDIFILDDGFQYRKLRRDCNIVVIGPNDLDFKKMKRLIPASSYREPFSSLKRADILILNYKNRIKDIQNIEEKISDKFPHLKVFSSDYRVEKFTTLEGKNRELDYFKERKVAAFCAIGYPDGFFHALEEARVKVDYRLKYPDHHRLSEKEFSKLLNELKTRGISDLIITAKDKYHLPAQAFKSNLTISIMEVEMEIEREDEFLKALSSRLQ